MADSAKREKIAAARKKLKQFKQKTGKNSPVDQEQVGKSSKNSSKRQKRPTEDVKETNTTELNSNSQGEISSQVEPENEAEPIVNGTISPSNLSTTGSTESLHQLSRQLNGLLTETNALAELEDNDKSNIAELESRNKELAVLLEKHSHANEQLNQQIHQIRDHAKSLQSQLETERLQYTEKSRQEVGPLKEQLQVHIQTIGILVAEKTELQSQVNQSQKLAEQRLGEIEDLSQRLKTSRQRTADLEKSLSTTNNSSQKFEQSNKEFAKEIDRLKLDLYKSNKQQEELNQQISEVGEKLQAKSSECEILEQSVEDLKKRLELAELYVQQLSNQSESESSKDSLHLVEALRGEKEQLQSQVDRMSHELENATKEKNQVGEQYQQYLDQMTVHNKQLTEQVTSLTEEREKLVTRQHELEGAVIELQQKLEDVASEQSSVDQTVHAAAQAEQEKLKSEYNELSQRHEAQIRDNAQLSRLLEEKERTISDLEDKVSEFNQEAGDRTQLLESIQSDKTALSRALTQNKDLKQQLAELQNGFVKMSNDNMELMTKIQSEQHSSKELLCRLNQQDEEIKQLRENLLQKESMVTELQEASNTTTTEKYQQDQIQDRLRHYEAQAQVVEALQRELHNSQDMVDALTTQNSELRTMLIKASERPHNDSVDGEEEHKRDDVVDSLTTAVRQLESERNQLIQNLKEQRELSDKLSVRVTDLQGEVLQKSATNDSIDSFQENDRVSRAELDNVKQAMEMVQEKYTKVMRDKAELTDKAEELEHLVLQLQGETDTIGEYISLYHHQRALLQQRETQKNEYISHLARDREEMQEKLGELQTLVMQLLGEKNMLANYHEASSIHRAESPDIQPHLHTSNITQNSMVNGQKHHHHHDDWPDYTSSESDSESEVETIVGGKNSISPATPVNEEEITPVVTEHETSKHINQVPVAQTDNTANKILNLLSEIGHSNLVDHPTTCIDHNFLPCKYCKGKVQIV
ncbi:hypothetical protein FSP39_017253 [Pinctada imbricata]|uniref:Golgin subfamily A conserved domain-containing protein n=1 Tax=Pinctada imbricata TaxID=66713 RepID=A0AA88XPV2_PINIB|nr:hypothetical protein FSP39_017253 [Pinctada imbricata]